MTDEKRALLGDHEAAKRLTEAGVLVMQGDCLELLKDIPDGSVDMVLTDPPYGIDYQSQWKKNKSEWMPKIKNDKRPFIDFIPLIKRVLTPTGCVMVFTRWDVQQKFIDEMNGNGLKVKNVLIWDKEIHGMGDLKHSFASRYESIIFSSEKGFLFNGKRPHWTGYEVSEEEMLDTIVCPHCKQFPFQSKEIQVYDVVRVVCFKEGEALKDGKGD